MVSERDRLGIDNCGTRCRFLSFRAVEGRGMIAFISGPMTGYENYNREAFDFTEKNWSNAGSI